ncbi:MAG: hypothetical protein NC320_03220 [Clostridium sp.]|nr:hypothetical protein [Clostridium sp.]
MSILDIAKNMSVEHNVTFRVLDAATGQLVKEYSGHNQSTDSMLIGIAHYLKGDGILNQGNSMLGNYIPKYISLGTMGLCNQEEDAYGLPNGIGINMVDSEEKRFTDYMNQHPGYGADGYDPNQNNNRKYLGLGPVFNANSKSPVNCELISDSFPRSPITYRQIIPETDAEFPETIDIVYGAMISTGALKQFREPSKDYIFITEAGLWSQKNYTESNPNGLLAGYRIIPSDEKNHIMKENSELDITSYQAENNRKILKQSILKVKVNQVVQVVWKIQLCSIRPSSISYNYSDIESIPIEYIYSQFKDVL